MTVADASVWVAYYHQPDLYHQPSRAWLQEHLHHGGIIVVPLLVLGEIAGPLARQTGNPAIAHAAVQHFHTLPDLELVPVDDALANLTAHLAPDLRLRGADAVYVALAAMRDLPLITWDREQLERGGQFVTVRRPDGS